jgi:hypothetical protein
LTKDAVEKEAILGPLGGSHPLWACAGCLPHSTVRAYPPRCAPSSVISACGFFLDIPANLREICGLVYKAHGAVRTTPDSKNMFIFKDSKPDHTG